MPATSTPSTIVWKRVPMVATLKPGARRAINATPAVTAAMASSGAGTLRVIRGSAPQQRERHRGDGEIGGVRGPARSPERGELVEEVFGQRPRVEPERVLDLQRRDHDRDAGREAGRHRVGNELDQVARAGRRP